MSHYEKMEVGTGGTEKTKVFKILLADSTDEISEVCGQHAVQDANSGKRVRVANVKREELKVEEGLKVVKTKDGEVVDLEDIPEAS